MKEARQLLARRRDASCKSGERSGEPPAMVRYCIIPESFRYHFCAGALESVETAEEERVLKEVFEKGVLQGTAQAFNATFERQPTAERKSERAGRTRARSDEPRRIGYL